MKILQDMKVGSKLVLLTSVLLLFIVACAGIGMYASQQINDRCNTMYESNLMGISYLLKAESDMVDSSRALLYLSIATESVHQEAYEKAFVSMVSNIDAAVPLFISEAGIEKGRQLQAKAMELRKAHLDIIPTLSAGADRPTILKAFGQVRTVADETAALMREAVEIVSSTAHRFYQETDDVYDNTKLASIICLIGSLGLGLFLSMAIRGAIATPLQDISHKADRVARGDLNQHFALDRKDELGSLAASLDQMVQNLRERIADAEQKSQEAAAESSRAEAAMNEANISKEKAESGQRAILAMAEEVEKVVSRLSAATEELSAQVEQCSRGTDMQRDRVATSATAMEEMNASVLEVAKSASLASDGAQGGREVAATGQVVVSESIDAISNLQRDTRSLRQEMEDLGQRAEAIGAIMTVISDIADQTNLLALNAAIEAARAGEAGRGFAVVADEVRKLAEKTMTATKEVGEAISGIQSGTRKSIEAVEKTSTNLESTSGLVKRSGEALDAIVSEAGNTADQVRNIATAAEQQSSASEEITRSLDEINRMADETASAMQQSAMAVSELAQQSQELQSLVYNLRK